MPDVSALHVWRLPCRSGAVIRGSRETASPLVRIIELSLHHLSAGRAATVIADVKNGTQLEATRHMWQLGEATPREVFTDDVSASASKSSSHDFCFWRTRALSIRPRCSRRSYSSSSPRSAADSEPSAFFRSKSASFACFSDGSLNAGNRSASTASVNRSSSSESPGSVLRKRSMCSVRGHIASGHRPQKRSHWELGMFTHSSFSMNA